MEIGLENLYVDIRGLKGQCLCCQSFNDNIFQGSYRLWKTWKVMEFKNFIFQASKVLEFNCRSLRVMEN